MKPKLYIEVVDEDTGRVLEPKKPVDWNTVTVEDNFYYPADPTERAQKFPGTITCKAKIEFSIHKTGVY